jgi:transposase
METMERKPRPHRAFTPEFKAEVVALVHHGGKTVGAVARDLDLTETAVRAWVRQAELDAGTRSDGLTTAEPKWPSCARSSERPARSATS